MLRNFPVQVTGAELLRLACCMITESGIRICATLHDALLIELTNQKLHDQVELAQRLMAEVSRVVLFDSEVRTTCRSRDFPCGSTEAGGPATWKTMMRQVRKRDALPKSREHRRS